PANVEDSTFILPGDDPISDESSQDEHSQIRALEEDQGIYYNEEVVVPPRSESDDDIPLPTGSSVGNGKPASMLTAADRPASVRSVRFSGTKPGHSEEEKVIRGYCKCYLIKSVILFQDVEPSDVPEEYEEALSELYR
ncbi:unnamed protein product, partial [Haemonchus placei]|uniref:Reverse transcriptase n=1 Tax=Haemonchus placei TaxID=6290 RepID=A0A0N4W2Z0_HAEPC